MPEPIPVTLLTGFLGAGKTTLLEHVLGAGTGLRFAIIENEYGDVGIDGSVVNTQSGAVFELNDGCVCCTVRDDLIGAFEEIIARRDEFDHVIIETTGLAEPGPVMSIFERQSLREAVSLKSVVTVVDAHHVDASLEDVSTCAEQITYADLILLNKIDGVSPERLEVTEARLRALNPLAQVVRAERSRIDVEFMLNYDRGAAEVDGTSDQQSDHAHQHHDHHDHHDHAHDHHDHGHHDHHHHDHDHHEHDATILSLVVEGDGDVNVDTLDVWLGDLARSHNPTLLRMKGILAVPDDPRRFIFNGVRQSVEVRPGRPWNNEPRFNRIVFIGRGLDQAALQSGLDACLLVTPEIGSPIR